MDKEVGGKVALKPEQLVKMSNLTHCGCTTFQEIYTQLTIKQTPLLYPHTTGRDIQRDTTERDTRRDTKRERWRARLRKKKKKLFTRSFPHLLAGLKRSLHSFIYSIFASCCSCFFFYSLMFFLFVGVKLRPNSLSPPSTS